MGHVTLKGPNRLGAGDMDEGATASRAAIAAYAQEDGSRGQAAAEAVLPARRALWRLAEVHMPHALAASLRARLAPSEVRELRRALADWLDPPPLCALCREPFDEAVPRPCRAARQRVWLGRGRRPGPTVCRASRGPRALRAGAAMARSVARCGTLALFTPLQLDPACAAAARLLRHGAGAYDLVVDRDARTLLDITATRSAVANEATHAAHGEEPTAIATLSHASHASTHPDVQVARRHFDRVLNDAILANGPLILKCQLRQYSPNGSATRADLVQGGAMGCRRALLDYDPAVARFSTYAIHWIRQGAGESFAERDLVAVPDWAAGLRHAVEDRDLHTAQLLRLIGTVAETRLQTPRNELPPADNRKGKRTKSVQGEHGIVNPINVHHDGTIARQRAALHAEAIAELAAYAGLARAVIEPATKATKGVAAKPAKTLALAITIEAVHAALAKAAALPARAKTDTGDEAARVRVAAYVAARLGLRNGAKAVTGGALLTALRSGTAVIVGIGTGEHDDAGGDDGPGAGRTERLPEHIADEAPDPEEAAAEEDEARRQMAALLAALETLRATDPEAAEVIRRRHAMDVLGDPETLEEIAAAPLRSTGRTRCREGVRQAYERGRLALKAAAPVLLGQIPQAVLDLGEARKKNLKDNRKGSERHVSIDGDNFSRPASPLRATSPTIGHDISRAGDFIALHADVHACYHSTTPTPEDFGEWAAARDAMASAF